MVPRWLAVVLHALTAGAVLTLALTVPALAGTGTLAVHGVTGVATDVATCDTRIEIGFRFDITDLPLSNGHIDDASVSAATITIDGAPATAYGTRTDFDVAPYYFATVDLAAAAPGTHVLAIAGGQEGVVWRAFDHSNPTEDYLAFLDGDYALSFVVPPCGATAPVAFSSFAAPVDDAPTRNVVKRGLTVPLRFSAARAGAMLTDPTEFTVSVSRARCDAGAPSDPVERFVQPVRAGELFYDDAAGEFVYRWTVSTGKHPCWDVTFSHSTGASLTAHFRTYASN